jgi:class 3 adenylate cyclase
MKCGQCGNPNTDDHHFCGRCGAKLSDAGVVSADRRAYTPSHLVEQILKSRSAIEGERKPVSVLFCDIADSTALAERLGAERMHQVLNAFFETAMAQVHRFEGTVNQFLGDGFMALFGAPVSHEDHERRAVLAALAIRHAVSAQADEVDFVVKENAELFALEVKSGHQLRPTRGLDSFCKQFPGARPRVVGTGGIETWFNE